MNDHVVDKVFVNKSKDAVSECMIKSSHLKNAFHQNFGSLVSGQHFGYYGML